MAEKPKNAENPKPEESTADESEKKSPKSKLSGLPRTRKS